MEKSRNLKYYNELDDEGKFDLTGVAPKKYSKPKSGRPSAALEQFVGSQDDSQKAFRFSYKAARFEQSWLLDSLGYFYEQHWITDVLRKIKAGKEASVYLCRAGEQIGQTLVAAKVYRPRMLRNLKNDNLYREGRVDLDDEGRVLKDEGAAHAILTRSRYGEQVRHQSWISYEYTALQALYAGGVDVPRPYEMAHNAILMDYLGDESMAAPALNEVDLDPGEAAVLFHHLYQDLDRMLAAGRVHGDLSAYNILYWDGRLTLIDFPQVVSPEGNRNAYSLFSRDMQRVCEYFIQQGVPLDPAGLARELWTAHGYRIRAEIHPRLLDGEDARDRKLWKENHPGQ
jgi:RIO kinase 1